VRASAEDAGIDHTTAYARRRTHAEFASNWERALQAHAERVGRERAEELLAAAGPTPDPSPEGEGMAKAQVKRAGHDRWGERKEKLFFDELAATANVKCSAKAAGVSTQAVFARRLRDPRFKAKWAAVLETGRAAIEMHLVEAANRSFDPDELDVGDVQPKVSIADAIRIAELNASRAERSAVANPFQSQAPGVGCAEDARERLFKKLLRLRNAGLPNGWRKAGRTTRSLEWQYRRAGLSNPGPNPLTICYRRAEGGTSHERTVRTAPPAMAAGRDPKASPARRQGHVGARHRQGADEERGVGQGPRQARPAEDFEAAVDRPGLRASLAAPKRCPWPPSATSTRISISMQTS
jgi:hypothetical protein